MLRPDDAGPLAAYVREQVEAIDAHAPDIPDTTAVHRTRVATRRLRSTLRVYGPLLALAQHRDLLGEVDIFGRLRDHLRIDAGRGGQRHRLSR